MNEYDFDLKAKAIIDKMKTWFPKMTDHDVQIITMFCTMFKDEYYNNK